MTVPFWYEGRLNSWLVPPPPAAPGCSDVSFQTIWAAIVLAGVSAKLVPPTPVTHGDDDG